MGRPPPGGSTMLVDWIRAHPVKSALAVVAGALLGFVGFQVAAVLGAFDAITSEDFAPGAAALAMEARTPEQVRRSLEEAIEAQREQLIEAYERQLARAQAETEAMARLDELTAEAAKPFSISEATSPVLPDDMFTGILLIGADESGYLADAIIYVLLPSDGSRPLMVSLPRDLYLPNRCKQGYTKLNANLGGCAGLASGPELLSLAVGDFTGVEVDHFARVDFDGFETVIDRLGGTTVCVGDHAVRDERSGLDLGPGCHQADGGTTLAWVRSRNPQYLVDGVWSRRSGSDFDRHRKQQDVLFQLAGKLSSYSSAGALAGALGNLADAVRMDSGFSVSEAASIAFRYRGISADGVTRLSIPVRNLRTGSGALALVPTRRFNDVLSAAYPAAAR